MHRLDISIPAAQIVPNTTEPEVGDIVIMSYQKGDKVIPHFAVKEGDFEDGSFLVSECNMWHLYPTGCGYRVLTQDYPNLIGFHHHE